MFQFNVDDVKDSCQVCCCEQVSIKPGTTEKVTINYAPWAVPIGRLHCNPTFELVLMETCPANSNQPDVAEPVKFATDIAWQLDGDLKLYVSDPTGGTLTFKALSLYGPWHGSLALLPDGTFEYKPVPSYKGEDRFYATASNASGSTTFEVMIGVGIVADTIVPTPHVSINVAGVSINEKSYTANFPIQVTPAADPCEVWRLTVLQNALDCSCNCYNRTDCFDIRMAKC